MSPLSKLQMSPTPTFARGRHVGGNIHIEPQGTGSCNRHECVSFRCHQTKSRCCQLELSVRQIKRLVKRFKREGPSGLASRHRGRPSIRCLPEETRSKAIELVQKHTMTLDIGLCTVPPPIHPSTLNLRLKKVKTGNPAFTVN